MRLAWPGFGSGGATGVASSRRGQKLPSCQAEPLLAPGQTHRCPRLSPSEIIPELIVSREEKSDNVLKENSAGIKVSEGG